MTASDDGAPEKKVEPGGGGDKAEVQNKGKKGSKMDPSLGGLDSGSPYLMRFHGKMIRGVCNWEEDAIDLEESGLLVTATGLGVSRIVMFMIDIYSRAPGLVFLLNTSTQEMEFFRQWIRDMSVGRDARVDLGRVFTISAEVPRSERLKIYECGGVVSVTSRILIVDMLDGSVAASDISGIIVNHGERAIGSSVEKFILRLYRDRNDKGFIRAFSDEASLFNGGLLQLEKAMKELQQRRVFLWPRFHVEVGLELNKARVNLVEVRVPVTKLVREIQEGLIECVEQSINELRRLNPAADLEEISLEGALFPDFDTCIKMRLSPFWHKVNIKTKKIVSDLRLLRRLLVYVLSFDCVSFYMFLKTVIADDLRERSEEQANNLNAHLHSWLMLEAAQSVLSLSRERLYRKTDGHTVLVLEGQPKWKVLHKIMSLIRKDREKRAARNETIGPVLIVAEGSRTCHQISSILRDTNSPPAFLISLFKDYSTLDSTLSNFPRSTQQQNPEEQQYKRRRARQAQTQYPSLDADAPELPIDVDPGTLKSAPSLPMEHATPVSNVSIAQNSDHLLIWPYASGTSEHTASGLDGDLDARILEEFRPHYIIIYDPNLGFTRRVEIYRTLSPKHQPLTVYSLVYDSSVEEQRYLSQIRKERSAFENLITSSANIAIPVGPHPTKRAPRPSETFLWDALDSRDLGLQVDATDVVVDIREFRSSLPFALYEQGARLLPCTLEVGDYVLSSQIVVERKSVADLLQSLFSGRLYSQANAMCLHYSISILLIEWEKDHPFSLRYDHHTRGEIGSKEIYSKLVLLCLTFPKLRILWSSSPDASAEMLLDLKKNQDEPDISVAAGVGVDNPQKTSINFAITPVDILRNLPSITSHNYRYVASKVTSLRSIVEKSCEWFEETLGRSSGSVLWSFINHSTRTKIPPDQIHASRSITQRPRRE